MSQKHPLKDHWTIKEDELEFWATEEMKTSQERHNDGSKLLNSVQLLKPTGLTGRALTENVIARYGVLLELYSDQGTLRDMWQEVMQILGVMNATKQLFANIYPCL